MSYLILFLKITMRFLQLFLSFPKKLQTFPQYLTYHVQLFQILICIHAAAPQPYLKCSLQLSLHTFLNFQARNLRAQKFKIQEL